MTQRSFTIVGGGQSGLQLACGLLDAGHAVHVVQNGRPTRSAPARCSPASACSRRRRTTRPISASTSGTTPAPPSTASTSAFPRPTARVRPSTGTASSTAPPAASTSASRSPPGWPIRAPRRPPHHRRRRHSGARSLRPGERSRHRRRRQGRDRPHVRARPREVAFRQAAARVGPHLRHGDDTAARALGRLLQPHSRRRRVFRLPGAHHLRPLRDHGVRGSARRADGRVEGRARARGASRDLQAHPRHLPALGGRALPRRRAHRRQRHPLRRLRAHSAQADRPPSLRRRRARPRRRGLPQRPDHRSGLEQRLQGRQGLPRRDPRPRGAPFRRAFMQATFDRYGPTPSSSSAGPTPS